MGTNETGLLQCKRCPSDAAESEEGSKSVEECLCNPGTYRSEKKCKLCPAGTFNQHSGVTEEEGCLQCPNGRTSTEGSASVENCKCDFINIDDVAYQGILNLSEETCLCNPGTYRSEKKCLLCPAGTYNQQSGLTEREGCVKCPKELL